MFIVRPRLLPSRCLNRMNQIRKYRARLLYAAFGAAGFEGYRIIAYLDALGHDRGTSFLQTLQGCEILIQRPLCHSGLRSGCLLLQHVVSGGDQHVKVCLFGTKFERLRIEGLNQATLRDDDTLELGEPPDQMAATLETIHVEPA